MFCGKQCLHSGDAGLPGATSYFTHLNGFSKERQVILILLKEISEIHVSLLVLVFLCLKGDKECTSSSLHVFRAFLKSPFVCVAFPSLLCFWWFAVCW